jgi:hypothetical protein
MYSAVGRAAVDPAYQRRCDVTSLRSFTTFSTGSTSKQGRTRQLAIQGPPGRQLPRA